MHRTQEWNAWRAVGVKDASHYRRLPAAFHWDTCASRLPTRRRAPLDPAPTCPPMTDKDLLAIIDRAVDEFNGDLDELESAIPGRTHLRSRLDGRMVGARRAPGHAPCGMALVCSVASSRVYLGVHSPRMCWAPCWPKPPGSCCAWPSSAPCLPAGSSQRRIRCKRLHTLWRVPRCCIAQGPAGQRLTHARAARALRSPGRSAGRRQPGAHGDPRHRWPPTGQCASIR